MESRSGSETNLKYFNNNRVISSSGTGREKLVDAFLETFREQGWQHFLYQNNVKAYYENKRAIPEYQYVRLYPYGELLPGHPSIYRFSGIIGFFIHFCTLSVEVL